MEAGISNARAVAVLALAVVASVGVAGHVTVEVADDGVGGADVARGSGLRGLEDRIAALDGTLELESPPGRGTPCARRSRCVGSGEMGNAIARWPVSR